MCNKFEFNKDCEIKKFWKKGNDYCYPEEAIQAAIDRAAHDFTARTEKKKNGVENEGLDKRLMRPGENTLVERLKNYFQTPPQDQDTFNSWHHDTCEWILAIENEMYEHVSYGKAQKILNITFKNLYCTAFGQKKERENENYFKFCHIALDSFTLEWIFRNIYPYYKELEKVRLCKSKTPAWSKFAYEEGKHKNGDEMYSYSFIVGLVSDYFKKFQLNVTPFQAEFVIWKEIQLEMATEAFYSQAYGYLNEAEQ